MAGCCGRPNNRASKGGSESDYYSRYAYLSSHQRERQAELIGSKCTTCDALTMGDPCTICGVAKTKPEEAKEG